MNTLSSHLFEINNILLTVSMKDYACHINIVRQDCAKLHLEYYGFDGSLQNTWVFSKNVIGVEEAIKEVLTFKYYENREELDEEIAKGYEAEAEEIYTIEEWFKKWGF